MSQCLFCNLEIKGRKKKKYCDKQCQINSWKILFVKKNCFLCGNLFVYRKREKTRKFCSTRCSAFFKNKTYNKQEDFLKDFSWKELWSFFWNGYYSRSLKSRDKYWEFFKREFLGGNVINNKSSTYELFKPKNIKL